MLFFPLFFPIKAAIRRLAPAGSPVAPRENVPNVLECGSGMTSTRVVIGDGVNLPIDIQVHKSTGTTTWYSELDGDKGCYLRRYGNGTFAIHLGTWHSKEQLHAALQAYRDDAGVAWVNVHQAALLELDRRIRAIQQKL